MIINDCGIKLTTQETIIAVDDDAVTTTVGALGAVRIHNTKLVATTYSCITVLYLGQTNEADIVTMHYVHCTIYNHRYLARYCRWLYRFNVTVTTAITSVV